MREISLEIKKNVIICNRRDSNRQTPNQEADALPLNHTRRCDQWCEKRIIIDTCHISEGNAYCKAFISVRSQ